MNTAPFWPVFLSLLGVAGCAQQSPQQTLMDLELALTASERAAVLYVRLPQCIVAGQPICSDAKTIAAIKQADEAAYQAMLAARAAPGDDTKQKAAAAAIAMTLTLIPAAPASH